MPWIAPCRRCSRASRYYRIKEPSIKNEGTKEQKNEKTKAVRQTFLEKGANRELLSGLLVVLVIFVFFWRPLFLGLQFYHSDTHALTYPVKELMTRELLKGRLPGWDPYSLNGYPIIGSYNFGVFLPQNLLFLLLPFPLAFKLFVVLKHLLAGCFQFLLLRRLGLSTAATLAGSIVFALSGPLLSISSFQAFSFECLPLMLWLWWRVVDRENQESRGQWKAWWLAVFGFAFVFLHGDLQTIYTGYLLAFFLPLAFYPLNSRRFWNSSLKLAGAGLVTAALTAVQLFPSMATLMESDRLTLSAEERLTHSLEPSGLPDLVNPFGPGPAAFSQDFIASNYVGLLTFVLAVAGVMLCFRQGGPSRRLFLFFLITTSTAFLLALGKHFPLLGPLTYVLPGLEMFRYPQKWLGLFACGISILAACGISAIGLKKRAWVAGLAALMVLEVILAMNPFLSNRLVEDGAYHLEAALNPEEHVDGFTPQDRLLRLPTDGMMSGLRMNSVVGDLEQIENRQTRTRLVAWSLHTLLGNTASRKELRRVSGITTFRYSGVERLWQVAIEKGRIGRAVDLFAAGWIATSEDHLAMARRRQDIPGVIPEIPATEWETEFAKMAFLERPTALPRALVVESVLTTTDQETALDRILAPEWDPHRLAVIHESDTPGDLDSTLQPSREPEPGTGTQARVHFVLDEPSQIVLQVEQVPSPAGLLILNDTYDPGWQAWVNGERTPIYRTNLYARGVQVPAGSSEVRFLYQPPWLGWGLLCSLLTLCVSAVLVVRCWRRGS